jgi:ubiquinone biosynthesis protein COQ4
MALRNPLHVARLLWSMARLTGDLDRLDRVFEINDHMMRLRTKAEERAAVLDFAAAPAGATALRERARLDPRDLLAAASLPPDTLGGAYASAMRARGLTMGSFPRLPARTDIEYVVAHYYETHDLWHVLTGLDTDPAGELGLQAFYLAQGRAYLPLLVISSVMLNTALYGYEDRGRRVEAIARGWDLGKRAQRIAGVDWTPHLARPLADVRRELGLERAGGAS